jgi:nucleotide-binding universal stress UspA family protein
MFEKIVAAVDTDPERSSRVLQATRELALAMHSSVLVVHVREVERPATMVAPTARASGIPPSIHFESEEAARQLVDDAVAGLSEAGVTTEGRVASGAGSAARELLGIANAWGANLIVVGDRGSHVTDLLLGSVAHRIVHLADCPVLLVR